MSKLSNDPLSEPWARDCTEYFADFKSGRFDETGYPFILPRDMVSLDFVRGAFVVGSAGADGITFCFRRGHSGVWAHYPIEDCFVLVADTLKDLEFGWLDGSISV